MTVMLIGCVFWIILQKVWRRGNDCHVDWMSFGSYFRKDGGGVMTVMLIGCVFWIILQKG